jgi:hypothetical protein
MLYLFGFRIAVVVGLTEWGEYHGTGPYPFRTRVAFRECRHCTCIFDRDQARCRAH